MSSLSITFIACCYNEANNISQLLTDIESTMSNTQFEWELLLVDDGSWDDTSNVAKRLCQKNKRLKYLCLTRNFGKEAAICAGLDMVSDEHAVLLLDADGQHPVNAILPMIDKLLAGADMVVALPKRRASSLSNKILSRAYHWFINLSTRHEITPGGGDFRLLSSKQVKRLRSLRERGRYMKGLYSFPGGKIETVEYHELPRSDGDSTFSLGKRLGLAIDGITSLTTMPIRAFSVIGCIVLAFSLIYLLYIIFEILFFGRSAPGFASLLMSVVILNGLIMIQVGIQGEYIAQLLKEVKQRPIYVIDEEQSNYIKKPNTY